MGLFIVTTYAPSTRLSTLAKVGRARERSWSSRSPPSLLLPNRSRFLAAQKQSKCENGDRHFITSHRVPSTRLILSIFQV